MGTAIAVVAALAAACCFAIGSLVQQGVARASGQEALRWRLLLELVRQPRWLVGVGLNAFSFALQGLALVFGALTLVQPLAATDVLFALPMIARRQRRRLTARDALGALMVAAGIALFLALSPPESGVSVPTLVAWAPAVAIVSALAAFAAIIAYRVRGKIQVVWLAAAAAVIFGLLDALTKSTVSILAEKGVAGLATHWEPYALLGTAVMGGLFGQSAFGAGALSLSLPVIDTLEPVSAVVIGTTVFGERLASSPVYLGIQVAGGVVAAGGIWVLARSEIVAAETREIPAGAAEPQARDLRPKNGDPPIEEQ